ncbi:sigma-54-dependent transcriptional regulator [Planctomycetota bacterium]
MRYKLLIVEDSKEIKKILNALFKKDYDLLFADTVPEALLSLETDRPATVITDYRLPGMSGMDLIEQAQKSSPHIPIIMLTAYGSIERAVEAMKLGAFNYLTKPINTKELKLIVQSAVNRFELTEENQKLRRELERHHRFESLVGGNQAIQAIYRLIQNLSNTTATVLISGESGTGKGLIARTIHYNSNRKHKPIETVDAFSVRGILLESELFGHEKGAFQGANSLTVGRMEKAHGGTLYISGIENLELQTQGRLLRALQDGYIERLGGSERIPVNVRLITGAEHDMVSKLSDKTFRKDLFYRLNVVGIQVPNLKQRDDDIPVLAQHFMKHFAQKNRRPVKTINTEAIQKLLDYDWPGNVRELENAIEHAVVVCEGSVIKPEHLPLRAEKVTVMRKPGQSLSQALEEPERHIIISALNELDWNRKRTADVLQITRATLYNKMKKYRIAQGE